MLQIAEREIRERMTFDNPWWEQGVGIADTFNKFPRRFYFETFFELIADLDINRAIVLMGPRRVGKTVYGISRDSATFR